MNDLRTQCFRIKHHLEQGKSLTALEALSRFGTLRLAARVCELRDRGWPIKTTVVKKGGKRVAEYSL